MSFRRHLTAWSRPLRTGHAKGLFHEAINEAAQNRYLALALAHVWDSLALLPSSTFEIKGRLQTCQDEPRPILLAIEGRDADEAERAARAHAQPAGQIRYRMMFEFAR